MVARMVERGGRGAGSAGRNVKARTDSTGEAATQACEAVWLGARGPNLRCAGSGAQVVGQHRCRLIPDRREMVCIQ